MPRFLNVRNAIRRGLQALAPRPATDVGASTSAGSIQKRLRGKDAVVARASQAARLREFNSTVDDWRVPCHNCGQWRVGSLNSLKHAHYCLENESREANNAGQAQEVIQGGTVPPSKE